MQRALLPILAAVLLALPASAARGDASADAFPDRGSSFSVGVFGGGHRFADETNLGVASSPAASAGPRSNALVGLRAAYVLRSWAAAEVEVIGMLTTDRTYERRASLVGYRLHLLAYLMPGDVRPFVLAGAGAIEVATTHADGSAGLVRDRDGEIHIGAGLEYRVLEHGALRFDVRGVLVPGKEPYSLATDIEASLGAVVLWGAGPRRRATPVPGTDLHSSVGLAPPLIPPRPTAAGRSPAVHPAPAGRPPTPAGAAEASPRPAGSPPALAVVPAKPPTRAPARAPALVPPTAPRTGLAPMASLPLPTIPGAPGRLPSIAELLGRAREIRFDGPASSKLSLVSLPLLGQLAEAMARNADAQIEIVAHTANSGNAVSDLALSKRRADAVKRALVEREVSANRLLSTGRGSVEPVAPSITRAGRKLNERVEMRVWIPEQMIR